MNVKIDEEIIIKGKVIGIEKLNFDLNPNLILPDEVRITDYKNNQIIYIRIIK